VTVSLSGNWHRETLGAHAYTAHRLRRIHREQRTAYQNCLIADLGSFGRTLVLDGEMQSTQSDEFIYHETLMHSGLLVHPKAERVLIMGGGEGASLREGLRHRDIQRLVMADLDSEVVRLAQQYLPSWHAGAFGDPRATLLIEDGAHALTASKVPYDVIVSDLPSGLKGGPAHPLYTHKFYSNILKPKLAPGGVFVLQSGSAHPHQWQVHRRLHQTLKKVFRMVRPFYAYVPSFDVLWSFLLCSDEAARDPLRFTAKRIDGILNQRRIRGLQYLDGSGFHRAFAVPPYLRNLHNRSKRS
jgi:spermidine synthase